MSVDEDEALHYVMAIHQAQREQNICLPAQLTIPADLRQELVSECCLASIQKLLDLLNLYLLLASRPVEFRGSIAIPGRELLPWASEFEERRVVARYLPGTLGGACARIDMQVSTNCPQARLVAAVTHEMGHHFLHAHGLINNRILTSGQFDGEKLADYAVCSVGLEELLIPGYCPVKEKHGTILRRVVLGYVPADTLAYAARLARGVRLPATSILQYVHDKRLSPDALYKPVKISRGRQVLILEIRNRGEKFAAWLLDRSTRADFCTTAVLP